MYWFHNLQLFHNRYLLLLKQNALTQKFSSFVSWETLVNFNRVCDVPSPIAFSTFHLVGISSLLMSDVVLRIQAHEIIPHGQVLLHIHILLKPFSEADNYVKDHPISYFSVVVFSLFTMIYFQRSNLLNASHKIYLLLEAIVFLKCVLVIIPYNLVLLRFESCKANVDLLCCFYISPKYAITVWTNFST